MTAGVGLDIARDAVAGLRPYSGTRPRPAPKTGPMRRPIGEAWHRLLDRLTAASSLVANDPVLDVRAFVWTAHLRRDWKAIRDEAIGARIEGASFPLWRDGRPIAENLARCPRTRAAIAAIPGIDRAAFAILPPGAHAPARHGATKRLITCHLGLAVPRDGDVRMRVHDRIVRWAEGETLVFDDTYRHEVWNDADGARVILSVRFTRPLRNPGKWLAGLFPLR